MLYKRGDVVLVPFPYAQDFKLTKKRPVLVVSSPKKKNQEITVAMITSVEKPGDVLLKDWKDAKLLYASYVRAKVVTIDPALILRRIGQVTSADLQAVKDMLRTYFGL